jgi:hypothetical protein
MLDVRGSMADTTDEVSAKHHFPLRGAANVIIGNSIKCDCTLTKDVDATVVIMTSSRAIG